MLRLIQTLYGQFDLADLSTASDTAVAIAKSVVLSILFTDQLAPVDRVDDVFDRRGWWHDPNMGTGLWYVRRQALTQAARQETVRMVREALNAEPGMQDVQVTDITPFGNVSLVLLDVRGTYDGTAWQAEFNSDLLQNEAAPVPDVVSLFDVDWDVEWVDAQSPSLFDVEWDIEWANV